MTVLNADKKIIILAANGFDENQMTLLQRTLTQAQLAYQVVAPEQGLVNGWQNSAWGHYFTVDVPLSTAMGSDYEVLIIVGGERSVAKLKQNPHTRRIISHFMDAEKPLAAIGAGVSLLALSPSVANRTVVASAEDAAELTAAKAIISPDAMEQDQMVLTASDAQAEAWIGACIDMIMNHEVPMEEAA